MRNLIYTLALILSCSTLVGCLSLGVAWKQDGVNAEQFLVDKETCRSRAIREVEDSYAGNTRYESAGGFNNEISYNKLMRQYDARQDIRKIFERCLGQRGYKKIDSTKITKTSEI